MPKLFYKGVEVKINEIDPKTRRAKISTRDGRKIFRNGLDLGDSAEVSTEDIQVVLGAEDTGLSELHKASLAAVK